MECSGIRYQSIIKLILFYSFLQEIDFIKVEYRIVKVKETKF